MSSDPRETRREAMLPRLRAALQALAQPASSQVSLFPDFVVVPDELALEFDDWFRVATTPELVPELTKAQCAALGAIDEQFARMSDDPEVWSEEALAGNRDWDEVRSLACRALAEFGWQAELPAPFTDYDRGTQ
jgi:hypothetical protein